MDGVGVAAVSGQGVGQAGGLVKPVELVGHVGKENPEDVAQVDVAQRRHLCRHLRREGAVSHDGADAQLSRSIGIAVEYLRGGDGDDAA